MDQGQKGHRKYAFLAGERMGHPGVPFTCAGAPDRD